MHETNDRPESREPFDSGGEADPISAEYPNTDGVTAEGPENTEIDDNQPPVDPPGTGEGTADEPEPGQALHHIVEFLGTYSLPHALEQAAGRTEPAIAEMEQAVFGEDENARRQGKADTNRAQIVAMREMHAPQLRAAGMQYYLREGHDDAIVNAGITDPGRFAQALDTIETPEGIEARERFNAVASGAVLEAVRVCAGSIRQTNPDKTIEVFGGDVSDIAGIYADLDAGPSAEAEEFVENFAENAAPVADRLERRYGDPVAVESSRIMAMARAENRLVEWAAGDAVNVLNNSDALAGLERLQTADEWAPAYRYLEHLNQANPDSRFTRVVRDTVLDDIDNTLTMLGAATAGESLAQLDADESLLILGEAARAMPVLKAAQARIRQIFGIEA